MGLLHSCDDVVVKNQTEKPHLVKEITTKGVGSKAAELKRKGYSTFTYKNGDTTHLMQQYYMVFLKSGANRTQDSATTAKLQEAHQKFLNRMAREGYSSLTGPMEEDGDLRAIVIYNTKTRKIADSLANLDPMVKAGRLKVEVHPWWTAKGGKLN